VRSRGENRKVRSDIGKKGGGWREGDKGGGKEMGGEWERKWGRVREGRGEGKQEESG